MPEVRFPRRTLSGNLVNKTSSISESSVGKCYFQGCKAFGFGPIVAVGDTATSERRDLDISTADSASQLASSPQEGLLARHPLTFYFLIAFSFSWLMFLPGVLTYFGVLNLSDSVVGVLGITGLLGPILSGFIMTALTEGREGLGRWLRRIVRWRISFQWYLFALVGLPLVMVFDTLLRPGALESFQTLAPLSVVSYLSAFVFMVLIGGPLFEELGWSGFALPRLQQLHGSLVGGLILGSFWALWHLPGFLIPSEDLTDIPPRGIVLDFVVFALALIGLRLVIIWVFNNTSGSVPACSWPSWCMLPGTPFIVRP